MCDHLETNSDTDWISEKEVIKIFKECKQMDNNITFKSFSLRRANEKMLGFLSDYWKLKIQGIANDNQIIYNVFIKSISKSNSAKATMVKELKLYEKELTFYLIIRTKINLPNLQPWSAKLVTTLNEAMVFEDLNFHQYRIRNKFETFDEHHTLLALQTLARFHAGTLVYEENKSKESGKRYVIYDEHKQDLNRGGYMKTDPWFKQCMIGALETVKSFSKYAGDTKIIKKIEERWEETWELALDFSHVSFEYRNVICHRDLWNNNILFRYKDVHGAAIADNCALVDFQAITCQPPAGDVMLLLYCNLSPKFREENMNKFINYYYQELEDILGCNDITMASVIPYEQLIKSCEKYRLWGLVVSACLVPQFWLDDDLTKKNFCNTASFERILTKDKASFIKEMIKYNEDYKYKVMQVFEEIVDTYCLDKTS